MIYDNEMQNRAALTRPAAALMAVATLCCLAACGGGGGGSAPTTPTNSPPTANAGPDQSVSENETVQLAGQGSDPDGGSVTYAWTQTSGPTVSLSSTTDPAATIEPLQVAIGDQDDVVLRLTVTDAAGAAANDTVTIAVVSADFVVFLGTKDDPATQELYKFDTQTSVISKINAPLVANGDVQRMSISPNNAYVAYVADQDVADTQELYVIAADGSGVTKINAPFVGGARVSEIHWSPDSQRIAYVADGDVLGTSEVYLVDRDGSNHSKINGNTAGVVELRSVAWSPDGRYIAQGVSNLADNRFLGINTHDTTTGSPNSVRISNLPSFASILTSYAWAPDSSGIAYVADTDTDGIFELYSASADGSGVTKLSAPLVSGGSFSFNAFDWSPDGSQITYIVDQDTDNIQEVYVSAADGSANVKISPPLVSGGTVSSRPDWSPDGSLIAYAATQDDSSIVEVYTTSPDGSTNNKLSGPMITNGDAFIGHGNQLWAPSGSELIYVADQLVDNNLDLFVSTTDGTANNQITRMPVTGGALAFFGQWSADGSRVVYPSRQDDPGLVELYIATPDGVSNEKISGPIVAGGFVSSAFEWSQ